MLVIAEPYFRYGQSVGPTRLQDAGARLLEFVEPRIYEEYASSGLEVPLRITVRVERGSTKVWVTVSAAAGALIWYGSIRQSIDYLIADARRLVALVENEVPSATGLRTEPAYRQKRLGAPGQLHRLFQQVERHEISADEATQRAVNLLYEQGGPNVLQEAPGITERLSRELHEARSRRPRQRRRREPLLPERSQPLLPAEPIPARRRTGVIVGRDPVTGLLRVNTY